MAIVHEVPKPISGLSRCLTTDFCPWANRFLYWLKEPIGWFALATVTSVVIGLHFSPIGWTLAGSLVAIMLVGIAWPLVAIHVTTCQLRPESECVHEDDECRMMVSVRNRLPLPVWGLAIEGYLDCRDPSNFNEAQTIPTVALACVSPSSVVDFGITVRPALRGRYPVSPPQVSCSFPFGIWTARRPLASCGSLTVWPKIFPVAGVCPIVGRAAADTGDGLRCDQHGDFVGVRAYRRGDSAKHIHWVASAKADTLIVTQRGGPECVELDVWVDTAADPVAGGHGGGRLAKHEGLADRIRLAASVLVHLHQRDVPMRVTIGDRHLKPPRGARGRRQILDALADVPPGGTGAIRRSAETQQRARIEFSADGVHEMARMVAPLRGRRAGGPKPNQTHSSGSIFVRSNVRLLDGGVGCRTHRVDEPRPSSWPWSRSRRSCRCDAPLSQSSGFGPRWRRWPYASRRPR